VPSDVPLIRHHPFRAPHHTISHAGLVGGGQWPRPGEISLAHRGVLFLDEMPEFGQHGLEVLRQPLEDKIVTISRAQGSLTFPANFVLVGAQNPCPCGYYGDPEHPCTCSPMLISRYQKRLSGPLLDRIDIHVAVPRVPFQKLSDERREEPSAAIRGRVEAARARQTARFANVQDGQGASLTTNADMGPTQVRDHRPVDETGRQLLGAAMQRLRPGDEPERAGISSRAQTGTDDRGFGWERAHPARTHRGGDSVSAAADGVARTRATAGAGQLTGSRIVALGTYPSLP
jgi:magnesium chelatase family protein